MFYCTVSILDYLSSGICW